MPDGNSNPFEPEWTWAQILAHWINHGEIIIVDSKPHNPDLYSADRLSVTITTLAQTAKDMYVRYREARQALFNQDMDPVTAAGIFDAQLGVLYEMWDRIDRDNNLTEIANVQAFPDAEPF